MFLNLSNFLPAMVNLSNLILTISVLEWVGEVKAERFQRQGAEEMQTWQFGCETSL